MLKKLFATALTLFLLVGFAGGVSAAAYISPSSQDIYGASANAYWSFTWSNGSTPRHISFRPTSGLSYYSINDQTDLSYMSYNYRYTSNNASKLYYPSIIVSDYYDGSIVGTDTATVHKRLSN